MQIISQNRIVCRYKSGIDLQRETIERASLFATDGRMINASLTLQLDTGQIFRDRAFDLWSRTRSKRKCNYRRKQWSRQGGIRAWNTAQAARVVPANTGRLSAEIVNVLCLIVCSTLFNIALFERDALIMMHWGRKWYTNALIDSALNCGFSNYWRFSSFNKIQCEL